MTEMTYQMRNPYHYTWISGDHIAEQHVHNLDVCNWIKGTHPVTAQGQGGRQVRIGSRDTAISSTITASNSPTRMAASCSASADTSQDAGTVAEWAIGTQGRANVGGG
jgi:myo-inositol 2-dehydrogenase / D-chiro-inositol 1-dehydrogenase